MPRSICSPIRGYFGTSLRDVAAAVGVRESALYNYFRSKDALFDALLTAHQHGRLERLAHARRRPSSTARALLEQFAVATLDGFDRAARAEAVPHPDVRRHAPGQATAASTSTSACPAAASGCTTCCGG